MSRDVSRATLKNPRSPLFEHLEEEDKKEAEKRQHLAAINHTHDTPGAALAVNSMIARRCARGASG